MASTFVPFDGSLPLGTNPGTSVPDDFRNNGNALRYAIASGSIPGAFSTSGGTAAQPAQYLWSSGAHQVRATNTWGTTGGSANNLQSQVYEVSQDSGATWASVGTKTYTYDSNGELTAVSGLGSMLDILWALVGKFTRVYAYILAHVAGVGAAVHGLGTMSTQSAAAVAITGGSVSCTIEREAKVALGSISASTPVNWSTTGLYTLTAGGSGAAITHATLPSGVVGYLTLDITNGGVATSLLAGCKIAGGVLPTLTAAGRDIVSLMCHDGATVTIVGVLLDVK